MMRAALLLVAVIVSAPAAAAPSAAATRELHALFDREWERSLREQPESASLLADSRYDDRWTDLTVTAHALRIDGDRKALLALGKIKRDALSPADQLNYDLFRRQYELSIEGYRYRDFLMAVDPIGWNGFQSAGALASNLPFANAAAYEAWIRRLNTHAKAVDQTIELLRQGVREGLVPPRVTMERLPAALRMYADTAPEEHPLAAPFKRMPASLAPAQKAQLAAAGRLAIEQQVRPAYRRFLEYFEKDYLPACRDTIGADALPEGRAYYAFRARLSTTTDLAPDAIHEIGLAEVARIRGEMEKIREQVGFKGDLKDFFAHLRTEKRYFHDSPQALLEAYRAIAKRIDPELVKLFGRLPRAPYGVRAIPDHEAPNATTAYYFPAADDGSRPGWYYVNLYRPDTRPKWEMEALSLHEAVPGHHLQMALAQELGELPNFRRLGGFTAFVEGWALYSESLGSELGLYQEPYSRFGQLTYEMWRAVRLVVDTGIHSRGWSRQQAIDFFTDNAAKTANDIAVEVDRYISWPGQALAYKVGELKIKELRARAATALGERFDVRSFHDTVLGSGAVPLDVLERNVDAWIGQQAAPGP